MSMLPATQESDSDTAELLSESYDSTKFQLQQADRDIQMLRRKDDDFRGPSNLVSRRNVQVATVATLFLVTTSS